MKRSFYYLFILFISLFVYVGNVKAEEDKTCNSVSLNELRTAAANIKITYEPAFEEVEEETNYGDIKIVRNKYLKIKIYNMMSKLYIKMDSSSSEMQAVSNVFSLNDVGADGAITIKQYSSNNVVNYRFTIYSDAYGCTGRALRTINLTLPRSNPYANRQKCESIPEFYLCQEYVTFAIDAKMFDEGVAEYKAKLDAQGGNGEIKTDNTGFVSKTISTISKYKFVFVGIIVLVGVVITVIILKRKKSVL